MNSYIQDIITQALQNKTWLTLFIIFWSGAILSMGSCTIIRLPVVIGYVGGKSTSKKKALLLTLFFVLGLVSSYTILGVVFGFLSDIMAHMVRLSRYFYYLIGALALFIGAQLAGIIDFGLWKNERLEKLHPKKSGLIGAFLFGFIFALFEAPICPCCGPVLFILAGLTFVEGKILYGILIFLVYALGQSFPLFLIGSFTGVIKYISPRVEKIEKAIKMVAGSILITLAIFFFFVG